MGSRLRRKILLHLLKKLTPLLLNLLIFPGLGTLCLPKKRIQGTLQILCTVAGLLWLPPTLLKSAAIIQEVSKLTEAGLMPPEIPWAAIFHPLILPFGLLITSYGWAALCTLPPKIHLSSPTKWGKERP